MNDNDQSNFDPLDPENFKKIFTDPDHIDKINQQFISTFESQINHIKDQSPTSNDIPIHRIPKTHYHFDMSYLIPPPNLKITEKVADPSLKKTPSHSFTNRSLFSFLKFKFPRFQWPSFYKYLIPTKSTSKKSQKIKQYTTINPLSSKQKIRKTNFETPAIPQKKLAKKNTIHTTDTISDTVINTPTSKRNYIDENIKLKSTDYKDIDKRFKLRQQKIQDLIDNDQKGSIT